MSKPKLTPWFDCGTRPARTGWYEVRCNFGPDSYRYWFGDGWSLTYGKDYINRHAEPAGNMAYDRSTWRGLATPTPLAQDAGSLVDGKS